MSQVYRKMDVTRECISHSLELREMLLSLQTGFNLVSAAIVCATLKRISGLEPFSDTTEPRYLKFVTVSSFCPFTLITLLMSLSLFDVAVAVVVHLGLLGTDLHSTNFASSSSPAKPSMLAAKRRLIIVLPPVLTVLP